MVLSPNLVVARRREDTFYIYLTLPCTNLGYTKKIGVVVVAGDDMGERMVHLETLTEEKVLPTLGRLEEKMDKALVQLNDTASKESVFALQLEMQKKADKEEVGKIKETLIRWGGAISVIVFVLSVFGKQIVEALFR